MPRFRRLALFTLAAVLACSAFAQQAAPGPGGATSKHMHAPDPQQQLDRLTKQLQLTSDQQGKILPILQQRDQQLDALRNDASLRPADRRAKVVSIMQASSQQMDAVLTEPQREKVKAMREKAMERMEERRGQGMPASGSSTK